MALSNEVGPRGGKLYTCACCNENYSKSKIEVDHYPEPVTPFHLFYYEVSEVEYFQRLFCSVDNLQILCKECHVDKTLRERKLRREAKL